MPHQPGQTKPKLASIQRRQRSRNRRATFLSGTSGNRGPTVFTTCREMDPRGGKGEEKDVSGGLPPAASALLPLFRLGGRAAGGAGDWLSFSG